MERYEIDQERRLSDLVEAALRGEEAVLVRGGVVVADIRPRVPDAIGTEAGSIDLHALERLRARLPLPSGSAVDLVRMVRDDGAE
jgi:antitoxin (DNA-binding transcriptional repressor) of toxin-antitoxin stability system